MENNFWKFNIVITKLYKEDETLKSLGIKPQEEEVEDQIVDFYLNKNSKINSFRKSWVIFKGEYKNCIIVNFVPEGGISLIESPPLLISSENFLKIIKE